MARLRLYRDLLAYGDNQAFFCYDEETAEKHNLPTPFRCGCRRWLGGGVVRVEFYTTSDVYMTSAVVLIKSLEPIEGEVFHFNDPQW